MGPAFPLFPQANPMFRTGAQMFLIALVAGLFLLRESGQRWGAEVDGAFADWLTIHAPRPLAAAPPVILVAIDAASVAEHPWPWTPLDFSLFIQAAQGFSPAVVAVADVLDWDRSKLNGSEQQKLVQYERILRDALLRCPKPLLGAELGLPDDPQAIPPLQEVPLVRRVTGDAGAIPQWSVVERQAREEYRLSATTGFTNLPDPGVAARTAPMLLRYRGQIVPSFTLQAALLYLQLGADDVSGVLGSHLQLGSGVRVPINERGEMRVNFALPRTTFTFDELLLASEQVAAKLRPVVAVEKVRGSILLLARTDLPARTLHFGGRGAGTAGELMAAAIATIQSGAFPRRIAVWFDWALLAGVLLLCFRIPRWPKSRVVLGSLLALLVYTMAAMAAFGQVLVWLPLLLPAGLTLFVMLYRWATPDWATRPRRPVIF